MRAGAAQGIVFYELLRVDGLYRAVCMVWRPQPYVCVRVHAPACVAMVCMHARRWRALVVVDSVMPLWEQLLLVLRMACFVLYPAWAQAVLQIFACYRLDDGSGDYPQFQRVSGPALPACLPAACRWPPCTDAAMHTDSVHACQPVRSSWASMGSVP